MPRMKETGKTTITKSVGFFMTPARVGILLGINIALLLIIGWIAWQSQFSLVTWPNSQAAASQISASEIALLESTQTPTPTMKPTVEATIIPVITEPDDGDTIQGLIIMAISDYGYTHLFAYQPEKLPLTRLTSGDWDDIHPTLSPDGSMVAFSSHRAGQWDLYMMKLSTGETSQITDDLAYDGAPDWSPDGQWLTYETYIDNNLEIAIVPVDGSVEPTRVTSNASVDFAPKWSPEGRMIAFTSNRSGGNDIWIIDLDKVDDARYQNFTQNPIIDQGYPDWSPDGNEIAWTSSQNGVPSLYRMSIEGNASPTYLGYGSLPIWSPEGEYILTTFIIPDSQYLSVNKVAGNNPFILPFELPGRLDGITWGKNGLPATLPNYIRDLEEVIQDSPGTVVQESNTGAIFGRQFTIDLVDVEAPFPQLSALAIEPFYALRDRVVGEAGWDVLSSLENAFVPFTQPLEPGREKDWLYTGRSFTLPPILLDVGWMAVVKENYRGTIYWRVYIRARVQDGSQGRPLTQRPWDFNARFTGNSTYYEQGGATLPNISEGYWIDLTAIALEYGWERLPALTNWRSLFYSARFTQFVITSGLDWEQAILQLYPPEILSTPNAVTR